MNIIHNFLFFKQLKTEKMLLCYLLLRYPLKQNNYFTKL